MRRPNRLRRVPFSLGVVIFALLIRLWAGGPVDPFGDGERFLIWNPASPVRLVLDNGPLRASNPPISRDEGAALVRDVIGAWVDVPTAMVTFEDAGFLTEDVTVSNYENYIFGIRPEGNPIIFDVDGSITDDVLGAGAKSTVLGFATSRITNVNDSFYDYGFAVLNGTRANTTTGGTFRKTVLHEVGHMLGLDHTQAGIEFFQVPGSSQLVPIMFPFIVSGDAVPRPDDTAWVSRLYPDPSFAQQTGKITGRIKRRSGGFFQGANVVAVQLVPNGSGGFAEVAGAQFSCVSGFLLTADGGYEIPGLAPGSYAVFIEPLDGRFTEGSGVGPFDTRFTDFPKDYYNGAGEGGTSADPPLQASVINVAAAQTVAGIELVSNEVANDLSSLGDDDSELFEFPAGFVFPFYGKFYNSVVVNSDGNLTFEEGDSQSTARDEARFLAGPPRIAPLFTDLNPEQGGEVTSQFDGESLTFNWTDVPEFDPPGAGRNTFSVTLYKTGDIKFKYTSFSVTPDLPGPQTVVGVTPGRSATGTSMDLSARTQPIPVEESPVYQVFGGFTFDLNGKELMFQAVGQGYLYFPFYQEDLDNFTGFAAANDSGEESLLRFESRTRDGSLAAFALNPAAQLLNPQTQTARLGREIFGVPLSTLVDGWVRVGVDTDKIASFFQFGNGLSSGRVSRLDGSVAQVQAAQTLYFTRLYQGGGVLQGQTASTQLNVANPGSSVARVRFRLLNGAGGAVGAAVERSIAPLGVLREDLAQLFPAAVPIVGGMVVADVLEGQGVIGFELVATADSVLGFNAVVPGSSVVLYSAQLANGVSGVPIFTSIKIINTSPTQTRTVTLTPINSDGTGLAAPVQRQLGPLASLEEDAGELFGLGDSETAPGVSGSLRVEADGMGVAGDVLFGDPLRVRYAAALPLQSVRFSRAVFGQVANSQSPGLQTFTGLAFYNPGNQTATIKIRVFRDNSTLSGEGEIILAPGRRISDLLVSLVPSSAGQERGFVVVESDVPIVGQQLFGTFDLEFLSAVPPSLAQE